jgi:hypothetical protein
MDLIQQSANLFGKIKAFFKETQFLNLLKDMIHLPYAKTYMASSILFTIIFIIFTFPYDVLIRKELKKLENTTVNSIIIKEMNISMISPSIIKGLYIMLRSGSEISLKSADINLAVNPVTLLIKKDIKCDLQLESFSFTSQQFKIDFDLSGNVFLDFTSFKSQPQTGNVSLIIQKAKINISDLTLPPNMGGLQINIPPIKIPSMNLSAVLSGPKINIQNARIMGSDLKAAITGNITMAGGLGNPQLDIKLEIDADSNILKDYKELLSKYISGNKILLTLKGSLQYPNFNIGKTGQGESGASGPLPQ